MFRLTPYPGPKFVGIGFNKTGTTTLGACFELLGFGPVCHPEILHQTYRRVGIEESVSSVEDHAWNLADGHTRQRYFDAYPWRSICDEILNHGNYGPAMQVATSFRAFHDRPWGIGKLYQLMDIAYPGSKFILTYREPERWWRSVEHWLTVTHATDRQKFGRYLKHLNVDKLDKDLFIEAYLARNAAIVEYFRGRDNLLAINFEAGEGWAPLCAFLGVAVPDLPFPHANKQHYTQDRAS